MSGTINKYTTRGAGEYTDSSEESNHSHQSFKFSERFIKKHQQAEKIVARNISTSDISEPDTTNVSKVNDFENWSQLRMKQFQDNKNQLIVRSQSIPTSKNTDKITETKVIRAKLANDRHQQSETISINNSKISQTLPIYDDEKHWNNRFINPLIDMLLEIRSPDQELIENVIKHTNLIAEEFAELETKLKKRDEESEIQEQKVIIMQKNQEIRKLKAEIQKLRNGCLNLANLDINYSSEGSQLFGTPRINGLQTREPTTQWDSETDFWGLDSTLASWDPTLASWDPTLTSWDTILTSSGTHRSRTSGTNGPRGPGFQIGMSNNLPVW